MLELLLTIAVVGVIAWALTAYIPMPQGLKNLIIIVAIGGCVIMALHAFGIRLPLLH